MTFKAIKTEMSCPDCGNHSVYTDMKPISPTFSCACGFLLSLDFSKNKEIKEQADGEV